MPLVEPVYPLTQGLSSDPRHLLHRTVDFAGSLAGQASGFGCELSRALVTRLLGFEFDRVDRLAVEEAVLWHRAMLQKIRKK